MNQPQPRTPARCRSLVVSFGLAIVSFSTVWAPAAVAQAPKPCGEEGSWQGVSDIGSRWMSVVTRGSDATTGQIDLAWVSMDPTLAGIFGSATRLTPARGVWKRTDDSTALWTWIAYGLDAAGAPVYALRASGTHHMSDCAHLQIAYTLEVFLAAQDMDADVPIASLRGTAVETRILLIQSPSAP